MLLSDNQSATSNSMSTPTPPPSSGAVAGAGEFDYTDKSNLATTGKVACLLCQRQFGSEQVLAKHTAQSDLHKARIFSSFTQSLNSHVSWVQGHMEALLTLLLSFAQSPPMHLCDMHLMESASHHYTIFPSLIPPTTVSPRSDFALA